MRIVELHTYPVKSARGVALSRALLDDGGVALDRRFMFVDSDGKFLTQRVHPRMALIDVRIHASFIEVGAPDVGTVALPLDDGQRVGEREVTVWGDRCSVHVVSRDATEFARAFFGFEADLVRMPSVPTRSIDSRYVEGKRGLGFADAFPMLVASRASLDALNLTLDEAVPMQRFRPNIVVDGDVAFAEDSWSALRIGSVTLRTPKPCERCAIVNVDPDTGTSTPETLRALAKIHTREQRVLFGQNAIHDAPGVIQVGDAVEVI